MQQATQERTALTPGEIARVQAAAAKFIRDTQHQARLFVVRPEHEGPACAWGQQGGYECQDGHGENDPDVWYVVIGRETTDKKCERLAHRFGLDVAGLRAYRDDPRLGPCEAENWGAVR